MCDLRAFLFDVGRAFYAPRSLYSEIRQGRATPSWLCVLIYCLIYVVGAVWLYLHGFEPFATPWVVLSPRIYYLAEALYLTPLIFLVWILGAGTIHVLARLLGGQGRFDVTLKMTGYSFWAPWYLLAIADSVHATPDWLYNAVLGLSFLILIAGTTAATKAEERLSWSRAGLLSLVTVVAISGITFTYIR